MLFSTIFNPHYVKVVDFEDQLPIRLERITYRLQGCCATNCAMRAKAESESHSLSETVSTLVDQLQFNCVVYFSYIQELPTPSWEFTRLPILWMTKNILGLCAPVPYGLFTTLPSVSRVYRQRNAVGSAIRGTLVQRSWLSLSRATTWRCSFAPWYPLWDSNSGLHP